MSSLTIPISHNEFGVDHHRAVSDLYGSGHQSVQNDTPRNKCPHYERIMDPIPSNQQSPRTRICEDSVIHTPRLPSVIRNMSCYARRSRSRFNPYQLGGHAPSVLETRFVEKNILKRNEAYLNLADVQQGSDLFKRGMKHMPDETVYHAVITKKADLEFKCLRALTSAWELESAEKHAVLLQQILKNCNMDYVDSLAEASLLERILVKCSRNQLEDDSDFVIAPYTHDFTAFDIADTQFEQLKEISAERKLQLPLECISDVQDPSIEGERLGQERMLEEEAIEKGLPSKTLTKAWLPASENTTPEDVCNLVPQVGEYFRNWTSYYSQPSGDAIN
ncbi:hypothetical protein EV702DRAFT_1201569 [Suillus placidus]|uniref:Uncharacterized protein n=1 Tax=Suillus placidus TaxID=48579 RepID=A0A9P6ZN49_9AGAM|nr:hypothetical protein EV702DRAFT_1201569 [Suillus placidus]